MDPEEKKRIANEKRKKAVQEWKKNRSQRSNIKAVHHTFDSPVKVNDSNKLKLFNSDDEEDNNELNFGIRPQFEGQSGQHLLEKSSEFSSRFKLDERFKIDEKPVEIEEENDEKTKNFKILESILGYEVSEKFPEGKSALRKRQIMRFDPEDESTSKLIKVNDFEERPKKKIRKKKEKCEDKEKTKEQIPSSTERYIEVSTNFKEILKSASTSSFSLASKFSSNVNDEAGKKVDDEAGKKVDDDFASPFTTTKEYPKSDTRNNISARPYNAPQKTMYAFEPQKKFTFFISVNDERLKEGVAFFKRPKPLEELSAEWEKNRQDILDLFRKRRKISQRGYVTRPNASKKNRMFAHNKKD